MTFVLLHGAIGSWDELLAAVGALTMLVGVTYVFSRKKTD
jgi:formate hydrogenlyase subunit 3/multisubunit Na+/H+ antiporter MnhD subunit